MASLTPQRVSLALLVLLAACTGSVGAVAERPVEPFERGILAPFHGDLDEMGRLVRALVPHSRAYYFLDGARERGASYEVGKRFEKELNRGRKSGSEIHVTFAPVPYDQLIRGLVEGIGDVTLAPLAVTPARAQLVEFSVPIDDPENEIIVSGPASGPLESLEDLAGREVWVRPSSSYQESLEALNRRFAARGIEAVAIRPVDERLDTIEILELMAAGLIGVTVMDEVLAERWAPAFEGLHAHPDLVVAEGRVLAFAFRKSSPKLRKAVNDFVVGIRDSGFHRDIDLRYLTKLTWIRNPTTTRERRKLERALPSLRKWGERYALDPLLLGAMGYQESRLIQDASSRVGAIGVMQLMPATGAEMKVGDIRVLDNNIHAGAKYIRLLMDRFITGEPSDLDRHLLAFASYNAGPGRIRKLRREAAAAGLDPDVWFDNVEIVVARRVGRETVGYVSSIYKYYLAYTWMLEAGQDVDEQKRALRAGG